MGGGELAAHFADLVVVSHCVARVLILGREKGVQRLDAS